MNLCRLLLLTLLFTYLLTGCASPEGVPAQPEPTVETYRDVPGVTTEELAAIEALCAARTSFSYGTMLATESYLKPDGSHAGYAAKYCALLSDFFGVAFVPEILEWDDLLAKMETGELDFTGDLTPTPERRQEYIMSQPIAERMLRLYTHTDSDIKTETDISGHKVGFLSGSVTEESVLRSYPLLFTKTYVRDFDEAARLLESGALDAFVDESVSDPFFNQFAYIHSMIFFPMVHAPVSMTTANPALAPMISVIDKYLESGGIDRLYQLYEESAFEYDQFKLEQAFTAEEKAYLEAMRQSGAAVPVGFEHDNYPVSFYNPVENQYEGIAKDVLQEISALTGLRFEPALAPETTWAEIYEQLTTGEIPMTAQLLFSEARRDQFLWSAVPYTSPHYTLLSRVDFPYLLPHQVSRYTVGALKESGKVDLYRNLFPDGSPLVLYDTQNECLDALENGEIDLFVASEYTLLAEINYREKTDLKTNIKFNEKMDSNFGFNQQERVLASIIDKAQKLVDIDGIETEWTGRAFDYSKKMNLQRNRYLTAFSGVVTLLLVLALFLFMKNLRLNSKLKEIANTDDLTGIFSRRFFMELSESANSRSFRLGIDSFIIVFDLDHFKRVNDEYGHLAGDKVLREVAQRVKQIIRPYDILGRYGGEEFIVLLTDVKALNKDNAILAAERIRQVISATPVVFEEHLITVSASFGVSYAAPRYDLATATRYADKALYQAKNKGRDQVVFYHE